MPTPSQCYGQTLTSRSANGPPTLLLLPGLGADRRLFAPQQAVFPDLRVLEWQPPQLGDDLPSYAARLAEQVDVNGPLILGGCSLGGMVAYEMARILHPKALVLIGSAIGPAEIPGYLRWLSRLASIMPAFGVRLACRSAAFMPGLFGLHDPGQQSLFVEMLRASSSDFVRWACIQIGRWTPEPLVDVPILTLHGRFDRILPLRRRSVDVLIEDAGHLPSLSHAERVNQFLLDVVEQVTAQQR